MSIDQHIPQVSSEKRLLALYCDYHRDSFGGLNEKGPTQSQAAEHLALGCTVWGGLGGVDLTKEVHHGSRGWSLEQSRYFSSLSWRSLALSSSCELSASCFS